MNAEEERGSPRKKELLPLIAASLAKLSMPALRVCASNDFISPNKTAVSNAQEEMGKGTLDIVYGAYDFTLVGLPVETVADFQASVQDTGKSRQIVRRRALTFGKLSLEQLFSLKRFLLLSQYGAM